jgi:hypothetical protein
LEFDCEGVPIRLLDLDEAIGEEDKKLKDYAEEESEPE